VPPALRGKAKGFFADAAKLPPVPVDVYVDADGHLRRMTMDLDLGSFAGAAGVSGASGVPVPTMAMSLDLYDFGAPVKVEAPPADQIISLKDFGQSGGGMFGGHLPSGGSGAVTG
jgi:hypothetical protein